MAYGRVEETIWSDQGVRQMDEDARWLFLYLLTCPHRNRLGCFVLDPYYAAADVQWDASRVEAALASLAEAGRIVYDADTRVVLIHGFLKHNVLKNSQAVKGARNDLRAVPDTDLICDLADEVERHAVPGREDYRELVDAVQDRCATTRSVKRPVKQRVERPVNLSKSSSSSVAVHISNPPEPENVAKQAAGAAGVEKSVENSEPPSPTALRSEAERLIRSELLLGSDVANAGGRRLELDDQLQGWDQMVRRGIDPQRLNGAIRCLRSVLEGDLATKPIGLGLLRSRPALWNQATAAWLNSLPPPAIVGEIAGRMN